MSEKVNRRQFMGKAVAGTLAAGRLLHAGQDTDTLRIGLIGCGGYGNANLRAALTVGGIEIAALCDVDSQHLADTADRMEKAQGKRPKTFKDHQQLLDIPGLQAVIIATPPQWHALQMIDAVRNGLHVYCEKPLAYDVREGQAMLATANESGRVVQIGFQRRQSQAFRQAKQFLAEGSLGKVVQAEAQIHYAAETKDTTAQDPPASLDWDRWCGPAPKLPYSPQIGHVSWRLEKTTGHGHLVDWGIHLIDTTRMILDLKMPKSVQASGGIFQYAGKITTPDVLTAQFDFDRCPVFWRHRLWGATEYRPEVSNGIFFYCERGTVFAGDRKWIVIERGKEPQEHDVRTDMGTEHVRQFIAAVRGRGEVGCTIEEGYRSTATVKLAMIAYDLGRKIVWDSQSQTIVGDPQANQMLKREYRPPWRHPYQG